MQQSAKYSITVLHCVKSDSGNKQVPILTGKSLHLHCFKMIKTPLNTTQKKPWLTTTIFTGFLRVLHATKGRNILLFVDKCAIHCKVHHF
jgi:hypothetical protein